CLGRLTRVKRYVEGLIFEPTRLKPGLAPAPDVMPPEGRRKGVGRSPDVRNRASKNPSACRAGPARATARAGPFFTPDPRAAAGAGIGSGRYGLDSEETGCRACE